MSSGTPMESKDEYIDMNMKRYENQVKYIEAVRNINGETRQGLAAVKRKLPAVYHILIFSGFFLTIFAVSAFVKMKEPEYMQVGVLVVLVTIIVIICKMNGLVFVPVT